MADITNALHLTEATFDETLKTAGDKLVVVDFFAEWCGPCKMIAPIVEELAVTYKDKVIVTKVDVDENQGLSQRYGVRSIPTMLFIRNGVVKEQLVGFNPKEKLVTLIDKHSA